MLILSLLTKTLTLEKLARTTTGSVEVQDSFVLRGHVEGTQQQVTGADGREVSARAVAYLSSNSQVDPLHDNWRLQYDGRTWEVIAISRVTDPLTGVDSHFELALK